MLPFLCACSDQPEWRDALQTPPEQRVETHRIKLVSEKSRSASADRIVGSLCLRSRETRVAVLLFLAQMVGADPANNVSARDFFLSQIQSMMSQYGADRMQLIIGPQACDQQVLHEIQQGFQKK